MTWGLFWKILFVFVMVAFFVMAVLTTILGARDIRELFRKLRKKK